MHTTLAIQKRLGALGFDAGPHDGIRGPKTDAAIVAFKRSIGLHARPYLGPLTLEALFGGGAEPSGIPWLDEARRMRGLHERRDYGQLRGWFDKSVSWIDPREIAWCGAFVATCHRIADPDVMLPQNALGARNWARFGLTCSPQLGATLTFWRTHRTKSWHGHVGFYWGEDNACYHVLGGNQSNAVTVTRISKKRLLASRWPLGAEKPVIPRKVLLSAKGVPVSVNEA